MAKKTIEKMTDDELEARNRDLSVEREAILAEQNAITAEVDRRAFARRVDRAAAAGQTLHVAALPEEEG